MLDDVLARCRAGAPDGLVVFDLDSTLLNNRPRQARILREFGVDRGIPELAQSRPEHWTGWEFEPAMRAAGLPDDRIAQIAADFKAFWRDRFFTSAYCRDDVPIPGAPRFVRAVADTGARVCYVTGRHEAMREGTIESFRNGGFLLPDGDRVQLIMKPTLDESDDTFKAEAHAALRALGPVVAVFDNEPTHINDYRDAFPDAMHVHLATDCSPRPVYVAKGIPSIPDFSAFAA
ncbi:MAG: hypothetical protein D6689_10365 [Deltaproteobacteria bacterium]|nr:MAG: hypothetical protein D6689_10365 [Deltaproteobacteria bacterium]